jgi:hypothetical protein
MHYYQHSPIAAGLAVVVFGATTPGRSLRTKARVIFSTEA